MSAPTDFPTRASVSRPPAAGRRHDIDALRVFACYLLLLFHVGMVFNPAPFFHVRNGDVSFVFLVLCGFIGLWHMPLLFLLAGWSAAGSLRERGVRAFLRERFTKLAVPLAAGCALLAPVIKYLELRSGLDLSHSGLRVSPALQESFRAEVGVELPRMAPFDDGFAAFLPRFFTDLDLFTWSHLWFLAYLLVFTLVLLPLLAGLAGRSAGASSAPRWLVWAPLLPLVLVQLVLRPHFPGPYNLYDDWASVAYFVTFLLCGFALGTRPALEERIREERRRALGVGGAATLMLLAGVLGVFDSGRVMLAGSAVAGWSFVVALLGLARAHVDRPFPCRDYLVESAFPVYLLHQIVVVTLAYAVVELPMGIAAKFGMLLAGSTLVTLAVYHLGVRPFAVPRVLAGMKARGPQRPGRPARPAGRARPAPAAGRL